jgi:hypothetical protein
MVIRVSLNPRDRHALAQIEERLADADPRFAARLSAFARLADGGVMPERERIRESRRPVAGRLLRGRRAPGRPGARRPMYWIAVALATAVTIAGIAAALVSGNTGTKGACANWQGLACTRQVTPPAPGPAGEKGRTTSLSP